MRLGVLCSHPIQYYAPIFRELARRCDLVVHFAYQQTPAGQAAAGYGIEFEWDVDLLGGYEHRFLRNRSIRPGTTGFLGCDTPEISEVVATGGYDAFLVTGWNLKSYWQATIACRRWRVPLMVRGDSQLETSRNAAKRGLKRLIYPSLLNWFDACLYVGKRSRAYFRHFGVEEARLFFAPHCVDNDQFGRVGTKTAGQAWRRANGIAQDKRTALFVGRLVEEKRPLDFLRGVAQHPNGSDRVVALVVGSGPLGGALERAAKELGVDARFLGFRNQSELPAIYAAADTLCLPSSSETWGVVVNEAMACGTPAVVSSSCGCGPDLIESGASGYIYPTGDTAHMGDAIVRAIRLKRSKEIEQVLARKLATYSVDQCVAGILEAATFLNGRPRRIRHLEEGSGQGAR